MADNSKVLQSIISTASANIERMERDELNFKRSPEKWSKKEILGHLVDSAYNNHQRFLRAQQQGHLNFSTYDQNDWVVKNNYQNRDLDDVLETWNTANLHLYELINALPEEVLYGTTTDHNFHKICFNRLKENESTSLNYLIWDYLEHLEYHLAQIIPDYEKINPTDFDL